VFLAEKMPAVYEEWRAYRETLRSSGGEEGQYGRSKAPGTAPWPPTARTMWSGPSGTWSARRAA